MQMRAVRAPRFFYGWWIVAATFIIYLITVGTPYYAFAVFLKPLAAEFGWERATVSLALVFFFIPHGIAGMFAGRLVPRFGARWIITSGVLGLAASLFLLSSITTLWQFYAWYTLHGVGMAFTGMVPMNLLITNWFTKKRGRAMGIVQVGVALGALVGAPLVGYIIQSFGWRVAYIILGLLVVLVVPLAVKIIRTRPEEMGLFPDGEKPIPVEVIPTPAKDDFTPGSVTGGDKKTLWELFSSLPLWLIALGFFLADLSRIGVVMHQVALLIDIGIPAMIAAVALGFTGAIGGLGKLFFGYLADKLSIRYVIILCFVLQALGILLLTRVSSVAMMWVYVVIFGFAMGGSPTLMPLVVGKVFPLRHFGTLYGFVHFVSMIGFAVGPVFAGYIYDVTQSYSGALDIFLITYIVSIAAIPGLPLPTLIYVQNRHFD